MGWYKLGQVGLVVWILLQIYAALTDGSIWSMSTSPGKTGSETEPSGASGQGSAVIVFKVSFIVDADVNLAWSICTSIDDGS